VDHAALTAITKQGARLGQGGQAFPPDALRARALDPNGEQADMEKTMAISLSSLSTMKQDKPHRILIYGGAGDGKTTLASEFPDCAFLQLEDGTPNDVELVGWGRETLKSFADVLGAVEALGSEKHEFRNIALDSVSELQKMIFKEICAKEGVEAMDDVAYGRLYPRALSYFADLIASLNWLRNTKRMGVILIAHSTVQKFKNPEGDAFDRYDIDLFQSEKVNVRGMIEREMDAVLLVKPTITVKTENNQKNGRKIGDGGKQLYIHTRGCAAYNAKNRYGMPEKILFLKGRGYAELSRFIPGTEHFSAAAATEEAA
jgi:hypothetical protein